MRQKSYLEKLSEEKKRERLKQLIAELEDEMKELEGLQARIALTLARIRLILELEERGRGG